MRRFLFAALMLAGLLLAAEFAAYAWLQYVGDALLLAVMGSVAFLSWWLGGFCDRTNAHVAFFAGIGFAVVTLQLNLQFLFWARILILRNFNSSLWNDFAAVYLQMSFMGALACGVVALVSALVPRGAAKPRSVGSPS